MNCSRLKNNHVSRLILTGATLALLIVLANGSLAFAEPGGTLEKPDLSIGAAQFPDDDAIILRWEQHWTMEKDGTVHRRELKWLKLLNSRPIRRVADPRIDFVNGRDELIIHTAQTHLPNGKVLPVPDYSFPIAGPDDVAGWPEYADWQQMIVCFSGIENDAVIELDYEIVTPAGVMPWIDADLRLHDDYPILERVVTVTVPEGTALHHQVSRITPVRPGSGKEEAAGGAVTYRWTFRDLAGARGEPQSPSWQRRCGRLRFSTCPSTAAWVSAMVDRVNRAAQPDESIKQFAEAAVEDEADQAQRVRKIAKKLQDSFNFVNSWKTLQSLKCRDAADVLHSNYGNPLESAALCAVALRSLGMDAAAEAAVDGTVWDEGVPTHSVFAGVVVVVNLPDGPMYVHPQQGVFENPGSWGRHWLLSADSSGLLRKTYIYARGEREPSELHVTGKITVDDKGQGTGELRLQLTGLFYDPLRLETTDAQKALVSGIAGRLLTGFEVTGHSITTLSDQALRATVSVGTEDGLKEFGGRYVLRFGDGPAFLPDVAMPLARSYRRTDVQLAGPFKETVDVTVELPDGWKPSIVPASVAPTGGHWGTVAQTVDVNGKTVRLRRNVVVMTDTLEPADFDKLRRAVNDLRATKSLLLVLGRDIPAE